MKQFVFFDFSANNLRNEMIKRNKRDCEETLQNFKFLELLVNTEVTRLSFSQPPKSKTRWMTGVADLLFTVTDKCPNLQELAFDVGHHEQKQLAEDYEARDTLLFFSFSLQFAELQVLDMRSMVCEDFRLDMLAEYLPKLRYIIHVGFLNYHTRTFNEAPLN